MHQGTAVLPQGAKVCNPATLLHQQQTVKGFKDADGWLVDGHKDSPVVTGHILNGLHHNGSSTGIQTCTEEATASASAPAGKKSKVHNHNHNPMP
jgi:hypothetical protein